MPTRMIDSRDCAAYRRHGWTLRSERVLGGGTTDDSDGTWVDSRVVIAKERDDATIPTEGELVDLWGNVPNSTHKD